MCTLLLTVLPVGSGAAKMMTSSSDGWIGGQPYAVQMCTILDREHLLQGPPALASNIEILPN